MKKRTAFIGTGLFTAATVAIVGAEGYRQACVKRPKPHIDKDPKRMYRAEIRKKNNNYLFNFLSKEAVATLAQLAVAGKEDFVNDKIFAGAVEGRIKKQLKEICLLDQTFVRSDLFDGTVGGYIADVAKKMGAEIKIKGFVRYGKGEGLEKREDNFADEIAKMVQ